MTQLIKGYSKGNFHSQKIIHISAQKSYLSFYYHYYYFLNTEQKHNIWGGIAEKKIHRLHIPLLQAAVQVPDLFTQAVDQLSFL